MKARKSEWFFNALNPVDYEVEILLPGIENRMMKLVFNTVVKSIKKQTLKDKPDLQAFDFDNIKKFDIPPEHMDKYKRLLLTSIQRQLLDVKRDIGFDGVSMITQNVKKCTFEKTSSDYWNVRIIVEGQYLQKIKKKKTMA